MSDGTYFNGKRWVKMEEFRRPRPDPNKPPKKIHPNQIARKDPKR